MKFVLILAMAFLLALSLGTEEPNELLDIQLEDAASCTMCQTALKKFMTNPVPASLSNSCDSYANNAVAFTACRMVWVSRYNKITNLVKIGCQNKYGTLVTPCPIQAICNSLIMYPGAGKRVNLNNRYCPALDGFNEFPAIPPVMMTETTETTTLRKRE